MTTEVSKFSKEPRPVYYKELDVLGFDRYWNYPKDEHAPLLWAEANNYIYKGRTVARTKGGSLYTAPELIPLEDPEPDGKPLQFVDVDRMVEKNSDILETLAQETIQKVYNTYLAYKDKLDIFHVSFSGGKDSEVLLDIIQRALPHDGFVAVFGNTGMEFPDTYKAVEEARKKCENSGVSFYIAKSHLNPLDSWRVFGPPASTIRWCCSVHKTTPQLLLLRDIVGKPDLTEMAFVGVRADESVRRSGYSYISRGTKHKGQYSCNPILDWSSAEIFLYIYANNLYLSDAYKKGNSRAGCLVCPMSGDKQDYMRQANYPHEMDKYVNIIREMNAKELPTEEDNRRFIETGGWKARNNGRDIKSLDVKYREYSSGVFELYYPFQDWQEWLKTVGIFVYHNDLCDIEYQGTHYQFKVIKTANGWHVELPENMIKKSSSVAKVIKQAFRKAAYCIGCKECQADCPHGCISFVNDKVQISDKCKHCLNCHKPDGGCLLYKSLELPKGTGIMNNKSIDCYADHAPKYEWIQSYFELKDRFVEEHSLGTMMISMFKRFLRDAELMDNNKFTPTAYVLDRIGMDNAAFWGIMLVNLSYTPEVGWFIKNIAPDTEVQKDYLIERLKEDGVKDRGAKSIAGAYKRILSLPFGDMLGLGEVVCSDGKHYDGLARHHWENPDPLVILYSLYKFAEACDDYYQFRLSTLLDDDIERDGVSPTRIFGLSRETMIPLLNGLTANYPDFISASFTLDLENITLRSDKSAQDVLELF